MSSKHMLLTYVFCLICIVIWKQVHCCQYFANIKIQIFVFLYKVWEANIAHPNQDVGNNLKIPKLGNARGKKMYCPFKMTVLSEVMIENVKHFYLDEMTYEVTFQIWSLLH